ncbi:hypothetical protein C8R45DRAFT_1097106 [Mycena sanguinolenta]|nr:hypothetical protein C8R45DRAFT_1097106 [Mycena sanguinolenta]
MAVSRALQATPHLTQLTCAIRESDMRHKFDWGIPSRTRSPEWEILDKQLLEMHTQALGKDPTGAESTKLLDVHFSLRYAHEDPERYATFMADVMTQLSRVVEAGFLTFSHRVTVFRVPRMLWFSDETER